MSAGTSYSCGARRLLRAVGRQLSTENFILRQHTWHTEMVRRLFRLSESRMVTS
ncbi:hypothetical protein OV090_38225 [Nannocystis sp. RBIL2]|uniref:hypothetical protein n=1 Tax=Nannocystis sp. RBIL2 TaxID=2996788 RepID=UPI00226FC09B|nr:hypothetical protein [Nannocystis sp. RBIL2]MCY1070642.1 hypothetical protein [Nannocystis sp. RBIL2]